MGFPEGWPESCPPADAEDAGGVYFRLVNASPPSVSDFESHLESGRVPKGPPCLRAGLSVFRTLRDVRHQAALIPALGSMIAQATLDAAHGKSKPTKGKVPSHTTWWPYADTDRRVLFSVVEQIEL